MSKPWLDEAEERALGYWEIFHPDDSEVICVMHYAWRGDWLVAGTATNIGMRCYYRMKFDPYFSEEENEQRFVEAVTELVQQEYITGVVNETQHLIEL